MEVTTQISYNVAKSAQRMDDILNAGNGNYSDADSIPKREYLTYTNGYYVNVTALFIDMIGSSDMTDDHRRPVLAKIYRSFISECTAIMNSESCCKEININGDCVWGVFDTPKKSDRDTVFAAAVKLNSMIKILNYKLRMKNYSEISAGIGMDYGRALMVKSGYSGSGLNDVIWMGDVVNSACHIANTAGRGGKKPIVVSSCVYSNLNEYNQSRLTSTSVNWSTYYEGDVFDRDMAYWYRENCI